MKLLSAIKWKKSQLVERDGMDTALQEKADHILKIAEAAGVQSNFFFATTFQRYQVQLDILEKLEETIREEGMLVEKEYVKGRKNLYTSPAVTEYNKTTDSANKTVASLIRIIKAFNVAEDGGEVDPLIAILNDI